MAADDLGRELYKRGWQQGVLLPTLPGALHFSLDDPLTGIARTAKAEAEAAYQSKVAKGKPPISRRAFGFGSSGKAKERLVIVTQTCDIVKEPRIEPTVQAIRAFITTTTETLRRAGGSSKRQFVLDETRGLIAEMSPIVTIEKPVLLDFTPEPGAGDEATRKRFADWLADRFSRPAHDDEVVGAVIKPILDLLRQMQNEAGPDLAALDHVNEVRFVKLQGQPPYDVRLLFMVDEAEPRDGGAALAQLIGRLQGCFDKAKARLVAWDVASTSDILLSDFLATDKLDLDSYTYRGRTIQGLVPLPRL